MSAGAIVDLSIVVIFLIALIIGMTKGFNKLFIGFIAEFGGFALACALCVVVADALVAIPTIGSLSNVFTSMFSGEAMTTVITTKEQLETLFSQGVLSILSGNVDFIWEQMQTASITTLGGYLGYLIFKILATIICFIVILLLVRLVFKVVKDLVEKLTKLTAFKVINMILGAVWSLAVTYIIAISLISTGAELVIAGFFEESLPAIQDSLANSSIFRFLHDTNVVGQLIAEMFSMPLPDLFPA